MSDSDAVQNEFNWDIDRMAAALTAAREQLEQSKRIDEACRQRAITAAFDGLDLSAPGWTTALVDRVLDSLSRRDGATVSARTLAVPATVWMAFRPDGEAVTAHVTEDGAWRSVQGFSNAHLFAFAEVYLRTRDQAAVIAAARAFAKCKAMAREEWVEHGKVSPGTGVSLDKATDNLLTAVEAIPPEAA